MKPKSYIIPAIVILGVISSLLLYFAIFNNKNLIFVESYNRETTFELAEVRTLSLIEYIDNYSNEVSFTVKETQQFIEDYVLIHDYYAGSYEQIYDDGNSTNTFYVFIKDGFPYVLKLLPSGIFILEPQYAIFDTHSEYFFIPFPYTNILLNPDVLVNWVDNKIEGFDSYEDYKEYYSQLGNDFMIINDEEQTIQIRAIYYEGEKISLLTDGFPLKLVFNNDGFIIEYNESDR